MNPFWYVFIGNYGSTFERALYIVVIQITMMKLPFKKTSLLGR